ncbi:MAG: hypothetical protein CV045_09105 [Cyanobacteria bacterium M5B4]|nr:MAG: hypothetical protein CV045_09105 [Cyanobacteria bacterium M5B4]
MRSFTLCLATAIVLPGIVQANTIIYVAPSGQDGASSGTETLPFRTITAALKTKPAPGTIVQLAPGTYSQESGETFPIVVPRGVVLRGNETGKGEGVTISGGGFFVSPTFARQNVAILASDGSQVRGITLINNLKRGYGLWVESAANVAIVNNTFTDTSHDGVFLTGKTQALVLNNLFQGNRASGISAVGESTGEIRDNVFDNTGFGLSVGQKSAVTIVNNRITNNRSGIVLSNLTTPKLRSNLIANNREDGLVILKDRVNQPNPDLGTPNEPGENIFQNNAKKDINNATLVTLAAFGNQVDPKKVVNVDLSGAPTLSNLPPEPPKTIPPTTVPAPVVIDRQPTPPKAIPPGGIAVPVAPKPQPSATNPFRFRVFVPIESEARTAQLKTIVPDAFVTTRNGQRRLQVGAYKSQSEADAKLKQLSEAGFKGTIEQI